MPRIQHALLWLACFLLNCTEHQLTERLAAKPVDCTKPVTIGTATYLGQHDGSACAWKGIRFAVPPTGPLRFTFAQPTRPSGVFEARQYRHTCLQATASRSKVFERNLRLMKTVFGSTFGHPPLPPTVPGAWLAGHGLDLRWGLLAGQWSNRAV